MQELSKVRVDKNVVEGGQRLPTSPMLKQSEPVVNRSYPYSCQGNALFMQSFENSGLKVDRPIADGATRQSSESS